MLRLSLITALVLGCLGCLKTELTPEPLNPAVTRLRLDNQQQIGLHIDKLPPDSTLGHQFLLVLIPFGRITFPELTSAFTNQALTKLTLAGYQVEVDSSDPKIPHLNLQISPVQLSAYDFIFFRRIVCHINIRGVYQRSLLSAPRVWESNQSLGEFKSMAFIPQLNQILTKNIDSVLTDILQQLGLSSRRKK